MATDNVVHQLAIRVGNKLRDERLMLATAESCTGGMVATAITDISGSSDWFERGFVTYSNLAKTEMIGVPARHDRPARRGERAGRESDGRRRAAQQPRAGVGGDHGRRGAGRRQRFEAGRHGVVRVEQPLAHAVETQLFKGDRGQVRTQAAAHALRGLLELLERRER